MRRVSASLAIAAALPVAAAWEFSDPLTVTATGPGVFPHLEAAGRASLAPGANGAAVIWEDNRDGTPQAWVALVDRAVFGAPRRVSTGAEAYEPALVALADERWLAAWEQDGTVWARTLDADGFGPARPLSEGAATQPTLARARDGTVYAAWARREGRFNRIVVTRLDLGDAGPAVRWRRHADPEPPRDQQLYPALTVTAAGPWVAWEDRRHGHTRILYARWQGEEGFSSPLTLNEQPESRNVVFGRGYGVTRVALDGGPERLAAVWMDKRNFQGGYDTFAALAVDGRFGDNEQVQDLFGENQPQWHPDVAVAADGRVVAAWDDPRDGDADVWYSWREGQAWSGDQALAAGPAAQTHPVLAFGPDGRLHAAWLERLEDGGSRIRYAVAQP